MPAARPSRWRLLVLVAVVVVAVTIPIVLLVSQRPTVTGVVVRVNAESLTDVRSFDLRTADGQVLTFRVGKLDLSAPGFNAQHLTVHAATSQPVIVEYEEQNGERVAVRLLDGPLPAVSVVSPTTVPVPPSSPAPTSSASRSA